MASSLKVAAENGVKTLAYPPMGAGFYGVPLDLSAKVMMSVISDHLKGETCIREVVICVFDTPQFNAFNAALAALD